MIKLNKLLTDYTKGWLCGDFEPSIIKNKNIEIGIKSFKKGETEQAHYHAEVIEYNIILDGVVKFNDQLFYENEIVMIEKNEISQFTAIEDSKLLIIKTPSIPSDKHIV